MTRWNQALSADLLDLELTRSLATAGGDHHLGSDDDHDESDERPTMSDRASVIDRLRWMEKGWERRQARAEREAERVARPTRDTTLSGSTLLGPSGSSLAGRSFDLDWTIDGEPAWLSYLTSRSEEGGG